MGPVRFADTTFWVALQVPRDRYHGQASELWTSHSGPVLITNQVLGETWTFLRRKAGFPRAAAFVEGLRSSASAQIHFVEPSVEREAWRWLLKRPERKYSFVDATSFAVMRRHRIREAYAFDGDFAAAGFLEVRP